MMRNFHIALTCLALMILSACDSGSRELRIVTPNLRVDRDIAEDLVQLLGDTAAVRLVPTAAAMSEGEALDALGRGTADVALVSNNMPFRDDVAAVMPLYPTVLHVAYRRGRDASSGSTLLRGAKVFADAEGTPSRRIFERIVGRLQLATDSYSYVTDASAPIDVVVLFVPISPERMAENTEFQMFSFGAPEDIGSGSIIDAAVLLNPQLRPFVIPEGTYGSSTPAAVLTVAVDKYLVARRDLDRSMVYDLANAVVQLRPALAGRRPGLIGQLDADFDLSHSTFVLHPGAQAYLQRAAPSVYERYSGVAEVVVSLLLALFSATLAGVRILRRRRKNRIDTYYARAIEIRDSVSAGTDSAARRQAITALRELQDSAFDQLIGEKLTADESFRIFVTLSNDVLRRLTATTTEDHD
jgi:uncharacterized protein